MRHFRTSSPTAKGLLKINSPICWLSARIGGTTPSWANGIVPVGTDSMACKVEHLHLGIRNALAGLVHPRVKKSSYLQTRGGRGATDIAQHRLPRAQGLASPVHADMTEQAMLNRIPFRAARRVVADCYRQPQPVTQLVLQLVFPLPRATPITPPGIGQDQYLATLGEGDIPFGRPPAGNGLDCKLWRIGRRADVQRPAIVDRVIEPIGDRTPQRVLREIMPVYH